MALAKDLRRHWLPVTLTLAMVVFFLASAIVSTATYTGLVKAQNDIVFAGPNSTIEAYDNGTLKLTFGIQLKNPSRYTLHVLTISWYVQLLNQTDPTNKIIVLGSAYVGAGVQATVPSHRDWNFSYVSYVADPERLSLVHGLINYYASLGQSYTVLTLPYVNLYYFRANIGEFKSDYVTEGYLNQLVTIEISYESEGIP